MVIVTGGGSEIGQAACRLSARRGKREDLISLHPIGRLGESEEVAESAI